MGRSFGPARFFGAQRVFENDGTPYFVSLARGTNLFFNILCKYGTPLPSSRMHACVHFSMTLGDDWIRAAADRCIANSVQLEQLWTAGVGHAQAAGVKQDKQRAQSNSARMFIQA